MKILTYNARDLTFYLYDSEDEGATFRDVGDYIEAKFVRHLGAVTSFLGAGGNSVPVLADELVLTLSCDNLPAELVQFRYCNNLTGTLMRNRRAGEPLRMWPVVNTNRNYTWSQVVVNGFRVGITGLVKVSVK